MTRSNVPRWSTPDAELPEELAQLLRQARAALGTGDEVAELGRRLAVVLGPASGLPGAGEAVAPTPSVAPDSVATHGAGAGPADPGAPGPLGSSSEVGSAGRLATASRAASVGRNAARAWGGAMVLVLGAVGAGIWTTWRAAPPNPATRLDPAALVGETRSPRRVSTDGEEVPSELLVPPPEAVVAAPVPESAVVEPPTRGHEEIGVPAEPAPSSSASGVSAGPAPASAPPHSRRRAPQRERLDEAGLLRRAQSALGRDPSAALALTREHEARFRHGALAQEREVIAIEALRRLGDTAAANARAAAFERRYHGSVHRPRLERAKDTSAPAGAKATTVVP